MDGMNSNGGAGTSCINQGTFEGLRDVVGDDGLTGLIAMYLDESEKMLSDIGEALGANDLHALERHVHLLKGVSSNFGLDQIVSTANAAMEACREGRGDEAHSLASELPALTREAQQGLKTVAATFS